jgi:hypothetical protein
LAEVYSVGLSFAKSKGVLSIYGVIVTAFKELLSF